MLNTFQTVLRQMKKITSSFEVTSGICLTIFTSVSLCIITSFLDLSVNSLGVDSSVFTTGHVHKLLSYCFIHQDVAQLLVSAGVLVAFSSALEKGVGTVRFLFLFLLHSIATGLLFALLALVVFSEPSASVALGLIPVALSLLGMVTISSRMQKAFFFGVSVPTATLPWIILLVVTLIVPGMVLLCNVVAIIVGVIYGKGWLSVLEMSESRAAVLEKKMPFRLLKRIRGVRFIPASAEERREILHARCKPSPGSYPVQAYAPASAASSSDQTRSIYEGWSYSTYAQQSPSSFPAAYAAPYGFSQGHGHSHGGHEGHEGHGHSHEGHGHSHGGHGHSHEGHGHSHGGHEGHGHSHEGHGHSHGGHEYAPSHYGPYTGLHAHSQYGHGLGAAAYGQYGHCQLYAGAYPTGSVWLPPSAPLPSLLSSGQGSGASTPVQHSESPKQN
ncbi:hypothetical protein ACEWY4_010000 [Coilia grayii]|uniref:Peptidase S54 rhomboid domain-containing protein n=1 Tax=Coilia grayii TaxID=363190 RepID=A0ABD1K8A6_9TELE